MHAHGCTYMYMSACDSNTKTLEAKVGRERQVWEKPRLHRELRGNIGCKVRSCLKKAGEG